MPTLSHYNWQGISDYSITSNMWWGINATKLTLYENSKLIESRNLTSNSPNQQTQVWNFKNKNIAQYKYYVIEENLKGKVQSNDITVIVVKNFSNIVSNKKKELFL